MTQDEKDYAYNKALDHVTQMMEDAGFFSRHKSFAVLVYIQMIIVRIMLAELTNPNEISPEDIAGDMELEEVFRTRKSLTLNVKKVENYIEGYKELLKALQEMHAELRLTEYQKAMQAHYNQPIGNIPDYNYFVIKAIAPENLLPLFDTHQIRSTLNYMQDNTRLDPADNPFQIQPIVLNKRVVA